jgi:hypothetical protein
MIRSLNFIELNLKNIYKKIESESETLLYEFDFFIGLSIFNGMGEIDLVEEVSLGVELEEVGEGILGVNDSPPLISFKE